MGVTYEDFEDGAYALPLVFYSDNGIDWARTNAQAAVGAWSIKSPVLPDGDSAMFGFHLDTRAGGAPGARRDYRVRFRYRTSTEEFYDELIVNRYHGGAYQETVLEASGETPWTEFLTDVLPASDDVEIAFIFFKDGSGSAGEDAVYVDELRVEWVDVAGPEWVSVYELPTAFGHVPTTQTSMSAGIGRKLYWIDTPTANADKGKLYAFDVDTNTYAHLTDPPLQKSFGGACVHGGLFYIFAGRIPPSAVLLPTAYRYDPVADTWEQLADIPFEVGEGAEYPMAAPWGDYIFLISGNSGASLVRRKVFRYHVPTDTWDEMAPLPHEKEQGFAQAIENRGIYVVGGTDELEPVGYSSTYLYDPDADDWTQKDDVPGGYGAYVTPGALLADGRVAVLATRLDNAAIAAVTPKPTYAFDPATETWEYLVDAAPVDGDPLVDEEQAGGAVDGLYLAASMERIARLVMPEVVEVVGAAPEPGVPATPTHRLSIGGRSL